jgi:hypothetical protein
MPGYLLSAPEGMCCRSFLFLHCLSTMCMVFFPLVGVASFESVYGGPALREDLPGVRMVTAAPELEGVIPAIGELTRRGVICSIGHRCVHLSNTFTDTFRLPVKLPLSPAMTHDTASLPPILHARAFLQVLVS